MGEHFDFKALRAELNFAQILRFYKVELNVNGNQHLSPCPLPSHREKGTALCFSAELKKGIWQCFGCHACGNILDFAVYMENLDPKNGRSLYSVACKLKRHFINTDGVTRPTKKKILKGPIRGQQDLFPPQKKETIVNAPLDFTLKQLDANHPYLKERGFKRETVEHFEAGFCSRGFLKDRIAIPLHGQEGNLIGYAGRTVNDRAISAENLKYKFPERREREGLIYVFDKTLILYNAHRMTEPVSHLIVVQGFFSVWWLYQAGFESVVAIMGNHCSDGQAELIVERTHADGCVWILPGNDHNGLRAAASLLDQVSLHRMVRRVELKSGCKPTSYTPDDLRKLLPNSEDLVPARAKRNAQSVKSRLMIGATKPIEAIVEFANTFPSLSSLNINVKTWNAEKLDAISRKLSSGEKAALALVLHVWNTHAKWKAGKFDVGALDTWDDEHRKAFAVWASDPWWC